VEKKDIPESGRRNWDIPNCKGKNHQERAYRGKRREGGGSDTLGKKKLPNPTKEIERVAVLVKRKKQETTKPFLSI